MSRKTTVVLAALVLALAASLSLSSVASSSVRATAQPIPSLGLSQTKATRNLERHRGYLRAAVCRGMQMRGLSCGIAKPAASGKPLGGHRKLLRAPYLNVNDPGCPFQVATTPVAVFATVTTKGVAVCVDTIYVRDIAGGTYTLSQYPETAILRLWDYTSGRWVEKGHNNASFGSCSIHPIGLTVGVFTVDAVKLCAASLQVNAGLFPPAGIYKGELVVITQHKVWTGNPVADYHSSHFCYFC
jgi:hypothetical protein